MTGDTPEGRIVPVILCGGSGTRLWPLSRPPRPKPFLPLLGARSLFEATLARCADRALFAPPLVVTGAAMKPLVESQMGEGETDGGQIIIEPAARNTAPAIALAAQALPADALMLVCPSDHHIADEPAFLEAVGKAAALAREGFLVAFGIAPTRPETGYGYIERGEALGAGFRIARFVEKPPLEDAEAYLAAGNFSWNGGIFLFRAGTYLEELAAQRPAMAAAISDPGAFAAIDGESVDYAVMEGTSRAAMVEARMGWSDIGNWHSLRDARADEADDAGNVVRGTAELLDCRNVMAQSDGPRVSVVGLEDVIVVVDGDEVLVTSTKGAAQVGKLTGAGGQ